jgi:hypothetical protein
LKIKTVFTEPGNGWNNVRDGIGSYNNHWDPDLGGACLSGVPMHRAAAQCLSERASYLCPPAHKFKATMVRLGEAIEMQKIDPA